MKNLLKLLLVTLLFTSALVAEIFNKPDFDPRLNSLDARAIQWWNNSDTDSAAAFNIGLLYDIKLKDYKKAELWYKQAWGIDKNKKALKNIALLYHENLNKPKKAELWYKRWIKEEPNNPNGLFNLALLYKAKLNNPKLAIEYYQKSFQLGQIEAGYNLALLYEEKLNKISSAIIWYEQSINKKHLGALKNLSLLYKHTLKNDIKAVEYFIALIDNRYPKNKVLNFFKQKWKLSDETIKKGYEAQLKSKIIPEKLKYKGGI